MRRKWKGSGHKRRMTEVVEVEEQLPPGEEDNPEDLSGVQPSGANANMGPTTTGNGGFVPVAMLDLVREQLERKFAEEVAALKRTFDLQMEEWRENEKRLTTYIDRLVVEVAKLEETIKNEIIDKRTPKPGAGGHHQHRNLDLEQPESPQGQMGSGAEEGDDEGGDQPQDLSFQSGSAPTVPSPPSSFVSEPEAPSSNSKDDLGIVEGDEKGSQPSTSEVGGVTSGVENSPHFSSLCDPDSFFSDHFNPAEEDPIPPGERMATPDPIQAHSSLALATPPPIRQVLIPTPGNSASSSSPSSGENPSRRSSKPGGRRLNVKNAQQHGYDLSRPLFCLCGQGFGLRMYLQNHIRYYTKAKAFFCMVCGKGFTFASRLRTHLESAHKGHMSRKAVVRGLEEVSKEFSTSNSNNDGDTTDRRQEVEVKPIETEQGVVNHGKGKKADELGNSLPRSTFDGPEFYTFFASLSKHLVPSRVLQGEREEVPEEGEANLDVGKGKAGVSCRFCGRKFPYTSRSKLPAHIARVHGGRSGLSSTSASARKTKATSSSSQSIPVADSKSELVAKRNPLPSSTTTKQHSFGGEDKDEEGKGVAIPKCPEASKQY